MNIKEYRVAAARSAMTLPGNLARIHGVFGVMSETGELLSSVKAFLFYKKPLDRVNVIEELGDLAWFTSYYADAINAPLEPTGAHITSDQLMIEFPALQKLLEQDPLMLHAMKLTVITSGVALSAGYADTTDTELHLLVPAIFEAIADMAVLIGSSLPEVLEANIAKLELRYPDKYSNEAAIARADKKAAEVKQ